MKIWAYVALAATLIGFVTWAHGAVYQAGYDSRDTEIRDDAVQAQNNEVNRRMNEWLKTQEAAEAEIIIEERIVTEIQYVDREIERVVETVVEVTPECRNLGDGYAGVLNKQVRASNSGGDTGSAAPTTLVSPL